ncbi:hypothetical protein PSH81_10840 [Pseudomonas sp. FP2335]|jgi:hypothetical protein|uniref:hypothetical protein n=1 Tax=Pseudomonas sp. FP2335 TaxID=2954092 RepID=UPI002733F377|nr:hypothetical protein [Pseudomonas sp. FP2335]WLH82064.1 hypothetical protein PSH81_10840 [Pseudomonas sp. FP2335]
MQFSELLAAISTHAIRLQLEEGDLIILGDDEALDDVLWDQLIAHEPRSLALLLSLIAVISLLSYALGSIVTAFACSTLIGIVFGFVPARNVARLDPIEALARD